MNLQTFFDNFELLAEAPNGVQKLRELILQLAVMGKLVPQDPSDEPASVLLEQIRFKKELIYQERKLKKEKLLPIKLDNIPFEIPLTWQWCRLEEITEKLGAGSTPKGGKNVYKETGIKFIRSQNVWNNGLYLENIAYIPLSIHQRMNGTIVQPGDILLNITGASIGRSCVVSNDFDEGNVSQHVAIVRLVDKSIRYYLHLCLISPYIQNCIMGVQVGISREGLSMTNLKDFLIPLPPLNEIIKIANKVDQLMKLCDELEARQQKKREARVTINNTAIAQLLTAHEPEVFNKSWQRIYNNFDLLYSTPENIGKLRSCILQLAVMGKLAPQDPHDEPASVLLDKIQLEKNFLVKEGKIKDNKLLLPVILNEVPFKLANSWEWVRFKDVAIIASNLVKPELYLDLPHVAPDNIEKETGKLLPYSTVREDKVFSAKHRFFSGQILYSKIRPNLAKATLVNFDGLCSADMYPINTYIDSNFLLRYMLSQTFLSMAVKKDTRVAMPKINQDELNQILVPVPPLNEQYRIVTKVNQLMTLCDQVEAQLKQSVAKSEKIMETAVRQLLDVNTVAADDIFVESTTLATKTVKQSTKKTQSHDGEAVQLNLQLF